MPLSERQDPYIYRIHFLTGYRIPEMLQVRRQLPAILARLESSLTASTAQAWETVQKREKITVSVNNNQVLQKLPGVLTYTGIEI